ncbi:hypothetical protein VUG52_03415 [Pseudomonas sp. LH21]|uniref:hypothetical protein n=1 Tax=Pseudomonas sp. LH21 TaxID=3114884 RepID=UPI002F91F256
MNNIIASTSSSKALEHIYKEGKDFILIALTGRTGSGCSTSAQILSSRSLELPEQGYHGITPNEFRKYKIIKKYLAQQWQPFKWLQIRTVISKFLIQLSFEEFSIFISNTLNLDHEEILKKITRLKTDFLKIQTTIQDYELTSQLERRESRIQDNEIYNLYFSTLPKFSDEIKSTLQEISENAYTRIYQTAGDNIRASGTANSSVFDSECIFNLPRSINKAVKAAHQVCKHKDEPCYIVIDAFRNPYEAFFFKERYADFYLFSINTENSSRLEHLRKTHKFTEDQIKDLDEKEYPSKLTGEKNFTSQNIQKCIEISDIHIHNPKQDKFTQVELKCQLGWYIALIMHPGLVMPSSIETCMQIAYSAKQSSGCISRQVGAAVTDNEFSLKSIGWNNTPQGQVPCLLRNAEDLLKGSDRLAYSDYERNNKEFHDAIEIKYAAHVDSPLLNGRNLPYCFKSVQNEVDNEKNQVHTRSLHAEENAFLQISKYGGQKLKGGVLFTTASPCELCAKKAYQLGISLIVYIDPYPGIATSHTLANGTATPQMQLFRGAVGKAFHQLYQPLMPFKDELETLLDISKLPKPKNPAIEELKDENIKLKQEIETLKSLINSLGENHSKTKSQTIKKASKRP